MNPVTSRTTPTSIEQFQKLDQNQKVLFWAKTQREKIIKNIFTELSTLSSSPQKNENYNPKYLQLQKENKLFMIDLEENCIFIREDMDEEHLNLLKEKFQDGSFAINNIPQNHKLDKKSKQLDPKELTLYFLSVEDFKIYQAQQNINCIDKQAYRSNVQSIESNKYTYCLDYLTNRIIKELNNEKSSKLNKENIKSFIYREEQLDSNRLQLSKIIESTASKCLVDCIQSKTSAALKLKQIWK